MVLRCYSHRNLLPSPKRLPHTTSRTAVTSAVIHSDRISSDQQDVLSGSTSATIPPSTAPQAPSAAARTQGRPVTSSSKQHQRQHEPWSFFSPRTTGLTAQRETAAARQKHPLVKRLLSELYSTQRLPAANRVWRAYSAVREASVAQHGSSEPASLLNQLEPVHHQLVLRAIDPDVAKTRKLQRLTGKRRSIEAASLPSSSSSATDGASIAFLESFTRKMLAQTTAKMASASLFTREYPVKEYAQRVNVIFREMRRASHDHAAAAAAAAGSTTETIMNAEPLPNLSDYNHVLSRLAPGGHIGIMASLWNELTGLSTKAQAEAPAKGLTPNKATYKELMIGLIKHAADQIERVQKSEASATVKLMDKRDVQRSARAAAGGMAKYGQVLAPSARGATILAAMRTMALLRDMRDHNVQPNQLTRDLVARTLRLAGHLDGLDLLMKQAYGIDLSAPGSTVLSGSPRDGPRPNVHTLNTILMALGEQATVPEMIAAYETLFRPTPTPADGVDIGTGGQGDQGGLFATDWKGLLRSVRERKLEQGAEQGPEPSGSSSPVVAVAAAEQTSAGLSVQPNTKTFEVMLQHCCSEVDPLRSPVAWPQSAQEAGRTVIDMAKEATEATVAQFRSGGSRAVEMTKRSQGDYIIFARYLLEEALEMTQRSVQERAQQLGITIHEKPETAEASPVDSATGQGSGLGLIPETALNSVTAGPPVAKAGSTADAEADVKHAHYAPTVSAGRALEPDFLPVLNPTSFSLSDGVIAPFVSLASQRKMVPQLRWVREIVSLALTAKLADCKVLDAAWAVWRARLIATKRRAEAEAAGDATNCEANDEVATLPLNDKALNEVHMFLNQLREQHKRKLRQVDALESMLYERLDERIRALAVSRKEHQKRRRHRHFEVVRAEEERRQAEAELAALKKANAAAARRKRELRAEEEAAAEAARIVAAVDETGEGAADGSSSRAAQQGREPARPSTA